MQYLALFSLFLASSLILFEAVPLFAQTSLVLETVTPNILQVKMIAPGLVIVNSSFTVSANVSNISNHNFNSQGSGVIRDVTAVINVPKEIVIDGKEKEIGALDPGETRTVTWRVKAIVPGNYIISAEAEGLLNGVQIASSDSTSISAAGSFSSYIRSILKSLLGF